MKPAAFDYIRATSLTEVHRVLGQEGNDARIIAGGQTLVPMLSMRLARPKVIVDIMHLPQLRKITDVKNSIVVGAAVRQAELLQWAKLRQCQPLLAASLPWVGHAQTRSRGTVCGSVAHADPSAEIPLTLVALDATIQLSSTRGRRNVAAREFFIGMMSTARKPDEMIESVTVPKKGDGFGYAFREFGRRHGDFAIVACAATVANQSTRLTVGGVADRPIARELGTLEGSALDDALDGFAWDLDARGDLHATASYRRELVRRIGRSVVQEARQCLG